MLEVAAAVAQGTATLDKHCALALAGCSTPDDTLRGYRDATNPRRIPNEPLSQATARAEQAGRAAAALGFPYRRVCSSGFTGVLTPTERIAFTSQPGLHDRLIRQLAEPADAATARYAALLHDLLTWARTQTTRAPAGPAAPPGTPERRWQRQRQRQPQQPRRSPGPLQLSPAYASPCRGGRHGRRPF